MNLWLAGAALIISLMFTAIFAFGSGRISSWKNRWIFLVILFLTTWAVSLWITPSGPSVSGVYWVQTLIIGFILALLILASIPPRPAFTTKANPEAYTDISRPNLIDEKDQEQTPMGRDIEYAYDLFFWLLIVLLVSVIILGYIYAGPAAQTG